MVLYKCLCDYETDDKDRMNKHLNRKISCIPEKDMTLIDINSLLIKSKFIAKIDPEKILYRCLCNYETNKKYSMAKHLNRKTSCVSGKDMTLINIDTLLIKGLVYKTDLTQEEKKERRMQQIIDNNTLHKKLGQMTLEKFAKQKLMNMKISSEKRNHNEPLFTIDNIIHLLEKKSNYIIENTILGTLVFPLQLTNGYYNSASFDRINNNLGYFEDNIEIRPIFLNTTIKLSTENIKDLIKLRENKQDELKLIDIAKYINSYTSKHFFYNLAYGMKNSLKHRNIKNNERNLIFDFNSVKECALFLIKKYIQQGGCCAYSYAPMCLETNNQFKISPERLDPTKGYLKDNIVLIVIGLNARPSGQFLNKHISDEERQTASEAGKFNQEYWDTCTKMTPEIRLRCQEALEYGKKILLDNLSKKIKVLINE